MSELGFNVWGAIGSAVGILTLIPLFLAWLQPRLPRSMLPSIMETHKEVKELLATALSQGLITDPVDLHQLHINMIEVDEVRAEVYRIKSWTQDAGKWWSGLSARMYILRNDLNSTRIQLAERNSQELKSLASLGLAGRLAGIPARKEDCDPHLPAVRPEIARSGSEKGHEASTLSEEHAAAINGNYMERLKVLETVSLLRQTIVASTPQEIVTILPLLLSISSGGSPRWTPLITSSLTQSYAT
ncbi:hypothetical protein ACG7TL_002088 [Trametes sanguinea]